MKFTNEQIKQMRYELANPEAMKKRIEEENAIDKFIETTKKRFAEQGLDFDAEYQAWKEGQK